MPVLFPRSVAMPCCLLPELESVLWAAVTFGAALGKHPNISVTIPAMDDCTLPSEWFQMNLVAFKKQWQNSLHFSSSKRILRDPVVLCISISPSHKSPTCMRLQWIFHSIFPKTQWPFHCMEVFLFEQETTTTFCFLPFERENIFESTCLIHHAIRHLVINPFLWLIQFCKCYTEKTQNCFTEGKKILF